MFDFFRKNKAKIGNNSSGNTINQGNTYINLSSLNYINVLSQQGQYEAIQALAQHEYNELLKCHPLYPHYAADFDNELKQLVSTPQTEEAIKKYPKKSKGIIRVDYRDFEGMIEGENPLEYAYRTQTKLELPTINVKEYLGEIEDPYPTIKEGDQVYTVINPPEFPKASMARVCSGNISIPVLLRRIPCFEYGEIHIASEEQNDVGFDLVIRINDDKKRSSFTMDKTNQCSLEAHLERERLIEQICKTKQLSVKIKDKEFIHTTIDEDALRRPFFTQAHNLCAFFENLIAIQKYFGCTFDLSGDVTLEDYEWAAIINASIQKQWLAKNNLKDDRSRAYYQNIDEALLSNPSGEYENISVTAEEMEVELCGVSFKAKSNVIYQNVRINNYESVKKHVENRKEDILLTFKPSSGNESFSKYYLLEDIEIQDSE